MRYCFIWIVTWFIAPLAWSQEIGTVPATGKFSVGYEKFSLSAGPDEYTEETGDRRRLLIESWYPAAEAGSSRKPWASARMGQALGEDFPFPDNFEKTIQAQAWNDAAPAKGKFPVIIFSHGLSFPQTLYQSFHEDLASRGFIIFAVNHPHGASLIEYSDEDAVDMSAQPAFEDETERQAFLARNAQVWAQDLSAVIEALEKRSRPLFRHGDASRIAVVGHSMGGTAAGLMSQDPRIKAAIAMEGDVRDPRDEEYRGRLEVRAPFMHLIGGYNRLELETGDYEPGDNAPVYTVVINGTGHAYFSDLIHFYSAFADEDWRERHRYEVDPDRVIRISRDYIAAFLNVYLNDAEANVLLKPVGYAAKTDSPSAAGYAEAELSISVK